MRTFDIAVIGAGIAGATAACELAARARVVLVERESAPGYHSTGRSAALLTENYGNETIRRLTIASRRFFERPPDGFADHPLLSERGVLWIARPDQQAELAAALEAGRALVPSIHAVGVAEASRLCSGLRPEYLGAAVLEPDAMDLDVDAILQAFLREFRRRGGTLLTSAEVSLLARDGAGWRIQAGGESLGATIVVNAAGAWCDVVGRLAGARPIGLVPRRRTAITFDAPPGMDPRRWPVVIDVDEHFYFKPEAGRILGSPADETPVPPCDARPDDIDVAEAVDRIERAAAVSVTRIQAKWAGLRSFVSDKSPVVGADPDLPGFFWLAGQGGYGVMTSPAMARITAGLVLGGRIPEDLAAIGLDATDLSPARLRGAML